MAIEEQERWEAYHRARIDAGQAALRAEERKSTDGFRPPQAERQPEPTKSSDTSPTLATALKVTGWWV